MPRTSVASDGKETVLRDRENARMSYHAQMRKILATTNTGVVRNRKLQEEQARKQEEETDKVKMNKQKKEQNYMQYPLI